MLVEERHIVNMSATGGDGSTWCKVEITANPIDFGCASYSASLVESGVNPVDIALTFTLFDVLAVVELPSHFGIGRSDAVACVATHLLCIGPALIIVLIHSTITWSAVPV